MKKVLLLMALVLGMSQTAFASFPDVPADHENADAIAWLQLEGVVQGYPDGSFKPDKLVNRAEFLKMLYELLWLDENSGAIYPDETIIPPLPFSDVPENEWYAEYVREAYLTGVVNGYPDGTFKPDSNINFAEAVKIVMNGFFDVDDLYGDGSDYTPCDDTSHDYNGDLTKFGGIDTSAWYWKYLYVADGMCILNFDHAANASVAYYASYDPGVYITRADMAEMLYRSHNEQKEAEMAAEDTDDEEADADGDEAAGGDVMTEDAPFSLVSSEFDNNGMIDAVNTCDGSDMSPELSIAGVPDGAVSLALILDDPDAPSGSWIHWLVWNIPPDTIIINGDGGMQPPLPNEAIIGTNSFGNAYYGGPCPPLEDGAHHYNFVLYALDITLDLDSSATKGDLVIAMDGHIIDTAELTGLYDSN